MTLRERRRFVAVGGEAPVVHDRIYPAPHAWNSRLKDRSPPSRPTLAGAWLRHRIRRHPADHDRYFRLTLDRCLLLAYRRAGKEGRTAS